MYVNVTQADYDSANIVIKNADGEIASFSISTSVSKHGDHVKAIAKVTGVAHEWNLTFPDLNAGIQEQEKEKVRHAGQIGY